MIGELYGNITSAIGKFYYPGSVHRANPCDLGTVRALRPVGRAIARLGSDCRCCSGARVLGVAICGLVFPLATPLALLAYFGFMIGRELGFPTEELNEGYQAYEDNHGQDEHARVEDRDA